MRNAIIAFLFFIFVALLSGTIKVPTSDDLTLVFASFSLLVVAWFYKREKNVPDKEIEK